MESLDALKVTFEIFAEPALEEVEVRPGIKRCIAPFKNHSGYISLEISAGEAIVRVHYNREWAINPNEDSKPWVVKVTATPKNDDLKEEFVGGFIEGPLAMEILEDIQDQFKRFKSISQLIQALN